jgi:energy-coupling factor transport system permease protein
MPALLVGATLCCLGLSYGSRRITRTSYRPDPWLAPEWGVAACGVISAVLLFVAAGYSAADLNPGFYPLRWPSLPVVPTLAIIIAALPGIIAPPPIRRTAPSLARVTA